MKSMFFCFFARRKVGVEGCIDKGMNLELIYILRYFFTYNIIIFSVTILDNVNRILVFDFYNIFILM